MAEEKKGWKDLPTGGVILDGGNSADYETGSWRSYRSIWYEDKCIHCLRCWILCPEGAILVKDQKVIGINYQHCKGCGICNKACPTKPDKRALEMKLESEFQNE
jgi:pyruvate ferredoxin oxidoreductase delta subunit